MSIPQNSAPKIWQWKHQCTFCIFRCSSSSFSRSCKYSCNKLTWLKNWKIRKAPPKVTKDEKSLPGRSPNDQFFQDENIFHHPPVDLELSSIGYLPKDTGKINSSYILKQNDHVCILNMTLSLEPYLNKITWFKKSSILHYVSLMLLSSLCSFLQQYPHYSKMMEQIVCYKSLMKGNL